MQHINEYEHDQSVIYHNRNQVIDRCDQWAGSNCRINSYLFKQHRNDRTDKAGHHHCTDQGCTDTTGDKKGECNAVVFK